MATSNWSTETFYDFTWEQVATAYWSRYPNPTSTHVLSEDTINREVRDGKLYSRRLLCKTNPIPKWGKRFYNNAPVRIVEDSVLDPNAKTLITYTRNVGMQKIMKVDEIVEYSQECDGRTKAIRKASVSSQVFGFSRAIRKFGIERFKVNSSRATMGFNHVLRKMFPITAANVPVPILTKMPESLQQLESGGSGASAASTAGRAEVMRSTKAVLYEYIKKHATKLAQLFSIRN